MTTKSVAFGRGKYLEKHLVVAAAFQLVFERQPDTECAVSRGLAPSTCIAEIIGCSLLDPLDLTETINAIIGSRRIRPEFWPRHEASCYPKDIAKHKLAARKKTSLNASSAVDQRLLLIACRRCPSITLPCSAISG